MRTKITTSPGNKDIIQHLPLKNELLFFQRILACFTSFEQRVRSLTGCIKRRVWCFLKRSAVIQAVPASQYNVSSVLPSRFNMAES